MTLRGHIENGAVVLDEPAPLPNGPPVQVEVVETTGDTKSRPTNLLERLGRVVGTIDDLPADAATNVDHYLYGHPKK